MIRAERLIPLAPELAEARAAGEISYDQMRARRAPGPKRTPLRHLRVLDAERLPTDHWRPTTRGQCAEGERPCPYLACRYSLAHDVTRAGTLIENHPGRELTELPFTCALDVADRGGAILEDVAACMNLTRERVRQLEHKALGKVRRALLALGVEIEEAGR